MPTSTSRRYCGIESKSARAPSATTNSDRPRACVSELRYPETTFDAAGTLLELAAGGSLATWQGERL